MYHNLTRIPRVEDRNADGGQGALAHSRHSRRLRRRIVTDDKDHPAPRVYAVGIGVPQDIHRAVQAWTLSVPNSDDPIELRSIRDVLTSPRSRSGEFFVEPGHKGDVVFGQDIRHAEQHPVHPTQRASLVSRDERRCIQPGTPVAHPLFHEQTGNGLHTGQQNRP
ncbi:hypothetical protein J2X34_005539 [Rhodococcus sp. BE178]